MKCKKCGANIPENSVFCNECGAVVDDFKVADDTVQVVRTKSINSSEQSDKEQWKTPSRPVVKKNGVNIALLIAVVVLSMLLVGFAVFYFVFSAKNGNSEKEDVQITVQDGDSGKDAPVLEISYCPETITGDGNPIDIDISGTVYDAKSVSTIKVNDDVVLSNIPVGKVTDWETTVTVKEGVNQISIVVNDKDGEYTAKSMQVTYEIGESTTAGGDIVYGTMFVNAYDDSSIFVRREPKKSSSDDYVLKISAGDTSTQLKYLGESEQDTEGYTWIYVQTSKGNGWVRQDIVKEAEN